MAPKCETVTIPSIEKGIFLDVWFYRPDGPGPYPVVVAGHGMTLTKEAGLAVFGQRWASEAGYASLILDYRGFGASGGQPRNLLVLEKQVQDFRAVIEWARDRPETFRSDKIVVMGSALAGLVIADLLINDPDLAGGMGHSPVLDGYSTLMSLSPNPRILFWTIVDYLSGKIGWSPHFVKAVGKPNEFAFLTSPSCIPGFSSMYEHGTIGKPFSSADNLVAPRVAFEMMSWKTPLRELKSPLLVVAGDDDDMIPLQVTQNAVKASNGQARLELFSGGHFDVMEGGKAFEFNMNAQVDFLRNLLRAA